MKVTLERELPTLPDLLPVTLYRLTALEGADLQVSSCDVNLG